MAERKRDFWNNSDIPERYRLRAGEGALEVDFHKDWEPADDQFDAAWRERIIEPLRAHFEVDSLQFPSPDSEYFGFGPVMARTGQEGDWITYRLELPDLRLEGDIGVDYGRIMPAEATLSLIFHRTGKYEPGKEGGEEPQRVFMDFGLEDQFVLFSAALTPEMVAWLRERIAAGDTKDLANSITRAMQESNETMFGQKPEDEAGMFSTGVEFREPQFVLLQTPGNACDIMAQEMVEESTWDWDLDDGRPRGYELTPHNLDTPLQQFNLLTGVAKLDELSRERPGT